MNATVLGLAAIALYLVGAADTSKYVRATAAHPSLPPRTRWLALAALAAHAAALYPAVVVAGGINLGIFSAASLVAWLVAAIAAAALVSAPVASLAVVILPFAAAVLALSLVFHHPHVVHAQAPGLVLHIALSLVAYSLFAVATLEALYLAFAERRLKRHTPVLSFLPPLPVMEQLLFQLTGVAFVLLSCGLAIGAFYVEDIGAQHLAHKIVFSLLAWLVFAVLVIGRYHFHWRGRRAVKYVIAGFVLLALGFFGSKFVLELVLGRA